MVKRLHHSIWALPFRCWFRPAARPEEMPTKMTRRSSDSSPPLVPPVFRGIMISMIRCIACAPSGPVGHGTAARPFVCRIYRARIGGFAERRALHVRHPGPIRCDVQWEGAVDMLAFGGSRVLNVPSAPGRWRRLGVRCFRGQRTSRSESYAIGLVARWNATTVCRVEFSTTDSFVRSKLAEDRRQDGFFAQLATRRLRLSHCIRYPWR